MIKIGNAGTKSLIIESALIIFSVMLGLFANDLRTSLDRQQTADIAWKNIRSEMSNNKKQVEISLLKQKDLLRKLNALLENKQYFKKHDCTFYDILHSYGGVNFPEISTAAWETAKNRAIIEDFSYPRLLLLTNIEDKVKSIMMMREHTIAVVYDKADFDATYTRDMVHTLVVALSDLVDSEGQLLDYYDKAGFSSTTS